MNAEGMNSNTYEAKPNKAKCAACVRGERRPAGKVPGGSAIADSPFQSQNSGTAFSNFSSIMRMRISSTKTAHFDHYIILYEQE